MISRLKIDRTKQGYRDMRVLRFSKKRPLYFLLVPLLVLILSVWNAGADDTDLYAVSGEGIKPNILIVFDTSGSMNFDLPTDLYDPALIYPGSYETGKVYEYWLDSTWKDFKDSTSKVKCAPARTALETQGFYIGQVKLKGDCSSSVADNRHLAIGNFLNFQEAILPPGGSTIKLNVAKKVINDLIQATDGVRVGVMVFNFEEGGRIVHDIQDLTDENRTTLTDSIDSIAATTWTPLAETLYEAGLYFKGANSYFNSGVAYSSPIGSWCQKNFIILMTDGIPNKDLNPVLTTIGNGGDVDMDGNDPGIYALDGSDYLDDVAKYLYDTDLIDDAVLPKTQNIITHTIGFTFDHPLLEDTAENGHGTYHTAAGAPQLTHAFQSIISSILEVSTSFAAPVVPISQMGRAFSGDKIYLSLFKPSEDAFWKGNIKKFGLATTADAARGIEVGDVLDSSGNRATDDMGYIYDTAASYWNSGASADGGETELGGVGDLLLTRDLNTRNIYTWLDKGKRPISHSNNLFTRSNSRLTREWLGAADWTERNQITNFVRGHDVYDEDGDFDTTEPRRWILGSFIHSRPEIVHYNSTTTVIYSGANDGMLHAFDDTTGKELWAYIPNVLVSSLKPLSGTGRVYYVDGAPRVWVNDVNKDGNIVQGDGDRAILVGGLRRGGIYYFALDVTDPSDPKVPDGWAGWGGYSGIGDDANWQATGAIGYGMTTDSGGAEDASFPYDEIGYTFATPVFGQIKDGGAVKDVFIIGGV
jgi:type IV pilus assembly protein PilY1